MTPFSAAKAPPLVCSVFSEALRAREELLECCCSRSTARGGAIGARQGSYSSQSRSTVQVATVTDR